MTKDGVVGKTSGGRQTKEKVSTTDDSFHTCTWTTLLDRTEKKSITSPVPSALGIVHYIDEIADRFKDLIDDGRRDNLITCTG